MNLDDRERQENRDDFMKSELGAVWPELRSGIWHTTSVRALQSIRSDGFIHTNADRRYEFAWPDSDRSYGRMNGMVCLFDFASASEDECFTDCVKWIGFFSRHDPITVAIELSRAALSANLVASSAATVEDPDCQHMWIPYVEAWHRGPIPTSAIRRYGFHWFTTPSREWHWADARDPELDEVLPRMIEICEDWERRNRADSGP
ncbi:MAG: hypothetical protein ACKVWV_04105 [Planctomycetota bacterium]